MALSVYILSSGPRSGSRWLTKALSRIENSNTRTEIFNKLENKELLDIEANSRSYVKYVLDKIYKNKEEGKNFIFSNFFEHFRKVETLITLILIADLVIFNYRKNILDQWISYRKAGKTGFWKEKDLTDVKVIWSEKLFMEFRRRTLLTCQIVKRLKKEGIDLIVFDYETIHKLKTDQEKILFINKELNRFGLSINNLDDIGLEKQNHYTSYRDVFVNYEEFLKFKSRSRFHLEY
jgi:LPS sulfotransferase NodH